PVVEQCFHSLTGLGWGRRGLFSGGRSIQPVTFSRIGGKTNRTIYDQQHDTSQTPGKVARREGQRPVSDTAVNQAYDGLGYTYNYYWSTYQRDSIDGQG